VILASAAYAMVSIVVLCRPAVKDNDGMRNRAQVIGKVVGRYIGIIVILSSG